MEEPYEPLDAAYRLESLIDELRGYPIAAELLDELETVAARFVRHLHGLPVCLEQLEEFVRGMRRC